MKMPSIIVQVTYEASSYFKCPDYLLSVDENERAEEGQIGSWWVKWDTLSYVNKKGEVVTAQKGWEAENEFNVKDGYAEILEEAEEDYFEQYGF